MIIREKYLRKLESLRESNLIKVVTGIRRCGKSTLLTSFRNVLAEQGVAKECLHFYNFENPKYSDYIADMPKLYDYIVAELDPDNMNYVFIDEVQNASDFQKLVDGLFILDNVDLYVTGSNAYVLSGELATFLSGRYIEIKVLPFSFKEFVSGHTKLNSENMRIDQLFRNYLHFGGLPEVLNMYNDNPENAEDYLDNVIESVIRKDVEFRHNFRDNELLKRVLKFLSDSIGSSVSANNIANTLKSAGRSVSPNTIDLILEAVTQSFIFYEAKRFDVKGKELLRTLSKYYTADLGITNRLLGKENGVDIGHQLENVVYFELLRRGGKVTIGKVDRTEVDFVVTDKDGYINYYQVAWAAVEPQTLERELAPLKAIRDSNQKYLLTTDMDLAKSYNGIRKLNVIDWLLDE